MQLLRRDHSQLPVLQSGKREVRRTRPVCESLATFKPDEEISRSLTEDEETGVPSTLSAPLSSPELLSHSVAARASAEIESLSFYVDIEVGQHAVRALVDSGATRSFAGAAGLKLFVLEGIAHQKVSPRRCILANGQVHMVDEAVTFKAKLRGREAQIQAYVMPHLAEDIILGMEFLRSARMVIDFYDQSWYYQDVPETKFRFAQLENASRVIMCLGLRLLEPSEAQRLHEFLAAELPASSEKPGVTSLTAHHIDVGDSAPIRQKPYHVTPAIRNIMWKEVDEMLKDGIVEPSQSDWASPVVMVKKPGGKYRFCIDFRRVNAVTKRDAYPIPNMTGILDELRLAHYITTLDLSKAYLQIPLTLESRERTAFVVPGRGLLQFKRMPYGLTNAPATFQRLLDQLVGIKMYPHVFVYLDDIIIVTSTFEEHLDWLRQVLQKIGDSGLTINREKCEFCCAEVRYLGFVVNRNGLQVDTDKVAPIVN